MGMNIHTIISNFAKSIVEMRLWDAAKSIIALYLTSVTYSNSTQTQSSFLKLLLKIYVIKYPDQKYVLILSTKGINVDYILKSMSYFHLSMFLSPTTAHYVLYRESI